VVESRQWWNDAARRDARWYIATAPGAFLDRGRRDADELIAFCGLRPSRDRTLLEIGAGMGRMTHRFAELYGRVIALDVSDEMLRLGREALAGVDNVDWVLGSGRDLRALPDRCVDEVFSYITLQHVPDEAVVLGYLAETVRVLRPGGLGALQVRRGGALPAAIDLAGHLAHTLMGRRVWSAAWRGTRIPERRLLEAVAGPGVHVELRPRGRRHLWVLVSPTVP
jgi:SAM-dependent methyltransferase